MRLTEGQIRRLRNMVEEDRYRPDVIIPHVMHEALPGKGVMKSHLQYTLTDSTEGRRSLGNGMRKSSTDAIAVGVENAGYSIVDGSGEHRALSPTIHTSRGIEKCSPQSHLGIMPSVAWE
jgi:DNA-binding FrmR family transcriptional regulator